MAYFLYRLKEKIHQSEKLITWTSFSDESINKKRCRSSVMSEVGILDEMPELVDTTLDDEPFPISEHSEMCAPPSPNATGKHS